MAPTKPLNSPCPSAQDGCFTLNEKIESGNDLFINGTTVMLLCGTHFINSTINSLLIQHVSSIVFAGHPYEQTTIECNDRFGFKFYNVKDVNISNLQFKFCAGIYNSTEDTDISFTLIFIRSLNIMIDNAKISSGGVLGVVGSSEGSVFQTYTCFRVLLLFFTAKLLTA